MFLSYICRHGAAARHGTVDWSCVFSSVDNLSLPHITDLHKELFQQILYKFFFSASHMDEMFQMFKNDEMFAESKLQLAACRPAKSLKAIRQLLKCAINCSWLMTLNLHLTKGKMSLSLPSHAIVRPSWSELTVVPVPPRTAVPALTLTPVYLSLTPTQTDWHSPRRLDGAIR